MSRLQWSRSLRERCDARVDAKTILSLRVRSSSTALAERADHPTEKTPCADTPSCSRLLFAPAPLSAAEFDPKAFDDVVEKALKEFHAPGAAVVIVKDGAVVYLEGFGVREKDKPEVVTPDTVFPIASCSKAFTATAVAMLADEGKLKWDDKVRDHLDYFRLSDELADRDVTLRDLLSHRTGMPRHDLLWSGRAAESADVIRQWGKGGRPRRSVQPGSIPTSRSRRPV